MKLTTKIISRFLPYVAFVAHFSVGQSVFAAEIVAPNQLVNGSSMSEIIRAAVEWKVSDLGYTVTQEPLTYSARTGAVAFAPTTTIGGTHNLSFNLAKNTPLLLTSLYWGDFRDSDRSTDPPICETALDRFACIQEDLKLFIDTSPRSVLTLRIDGIDFIVDDTYRFDSGGVPVSTVLTGDTAWGLPAGPWSVLYDGWFNVITGLSEGIHLIEYGFTDPEFEIMHRATVNVVPIPSSALLLLIGLSGFGIATKKKKRSRGLGNHFSHCSGELRIIAAILQR